MENQEEILVGTVQRLLTPFANAGNITFILDTGDETVRVVWTLGEIRPGTRVELGGSFLPENAEGKCFRAERRKLLPSEDDIRLMLTEFAGDDITETQALHIAAEFGASALDVMRREPERLAQIKGISLKTAKKIAKELDALPEDSTQYFLMQHYIWKDRFCFEEQFQQYAEKLERDPYYFCTQEQTGFSWADGDLLAARRGMPVDAPCCVSAALRKTLQELAVRDGQVCLPKRMLMQEYRKKLRISDTAAEKGYQHGLVRKVFYEYDCGENEEYVYLPAYYEAEEYIAARVQAMGMLPPLPEESVETEIAELETVFRMEYAAEQREALARSRTARMMILTGGPGTGKTTVLNGIILLAERRKEKILLAAPTGLAAKHMAAAAGRDAKTVHRLLGARREEETEDFSFSRNEENPLQADLIVVDESSMLDTILFSALLRACSMETRLIFIGDTDQLPPVGTGKVLQCLLESGLIPSVRLQQIHRQAQGSLIVQNAHRILHGEAPLLQVKDNDFFFFDRRSTDEAEKLLADLYMTRLPNYGYEPVRDIQVLTPMRHDSGQGVDAEKLNEQLQELVNPVLPGEPAVSNKLYTFHTGDKVMQIWNDYEMKWVCGEEEGQGIFNGDTGIVQEVVRSEKELVLRVDFDGHLVDYPKKKLNNLALAYAVTVHKSQGSEYPCVVLVLREMTGRWDPLAYRSLLYTAVTRAKNLLIVIGDPNKLMQMVRSFSRNKRHSCLREMLLSEGEMFSVDIDPFEICDEEMPAFPEAAADTPEQTAAESIDLDEVFARMNDSIDEA